MGPGPPAPPALLPGAPRKKNPENPPLPLFYLATGFPESGRPSFFRNPDTPCVTRATCCTAGSRVRRIGADGVMVGGTAAGLVDATTGEGIHEAATTGRLAAEAAGEARARGTDSGAGVRACGEGRVLRPPAAPPSSDDVPRAQARCASTCSSGSSRRHRRFADMLQGDRNAFNAWEWMYLYVQAAKFSLRALRA